MPIKIGGINNPKDISTPCDIFIFLGQSEYFASIIATRKQILINKKDNINSISLQNDIPRATITGALNKKEL